MSLYVTLTEENDWEGETWRFYIPVAGNDGALRKLKRLIDEADDPAYKLDLTPIREEIVDDRCNSMSDDTEYLPAHNKMAGVLRVPTDVDDLYKGGIGDFLEEQ